MANVMRRLTHALLAAAMVGGLAAGPAVAQVVPGGALNGPAGGTASTTAPSNNEGTPAGGTGTLSTTRVGPGGDATGTTTTRHHRRHHSRHHRHHATHPATTGPGSSNAPTDTGSSAGLNGSNAPAR